MTNKARLIWITPDAEKHIAYCARVSNPLNQENAEYRKLLKYCIKHRHWSIFEMANACIEVKTSIAVAMQIQRHKSMSFQVFSQRYSPVVEKPCAVKLRLKHPTNKQSSIIDNENPVVQQMELEADVAISTAFEAYDKMIASGIAPETARNVLPMCTPTTMYVNGTIRSWIHYLESRLDEGAQGEHQEVAKLIHDILKKECPLIWED
jgi:thymidylate synthase (FAD)